MKAILELPNFECLKIELKHQGLAECRLTGIAKDEMTQDKPRMEYRNYLLIFTALTKDGTIIRLRLNMGRCFIFEEEQMTELHGKTLQKREELAKLLTSEGISVMEGEYVTA